MVVLLSCYTAPAPVYRLSPVADQTIWLLGKEFTKLTRNGLTVAAAFDGYSWDYFILNVSIVNQSGRSILVAPEKFYYQTSTKSGFDSQLTFYDQPQSGV